LANNVVGFRLAVVKLQLSRRRSSTMPLDYGMLV